MMVRGAGGGGGKKGGGGGGASEARNTLRSRAKMRLLMVVSEGKTGGLKNGQKSIFANDVPVQNNDGTFNLQGVSYETRLGLPDQTAMRGFPAVESEFSVGIEVKQGIPIVQAVTNLDATSVRIKIRVPSLTTTDTENGAVNGNSVQFAIDLRNEGGTFVEVMAPVISGKCTAPYEKAYLVPLNGVGPWYIRIRRLSADSNNTTSQNQTYWSSFTVIEDYLLTYPDSAVIGIVADAESIGSTIPNMTVEWDGIEVEVPVNFDPIARTHTGIWNGTFKRAVTDNPAWIFRDIIVNDRYGLGEELGTAEVDKWALYEISKYCCENVQNGYGGQEPRFTFNGTIAKRDDAIRMLSAMAGVFRGIVYWSAGLVTPVADMPKDRAKLVTPANVIDGAFTYQGSSLSARHTQVLVQFVDTENNHKLGLETYEDPDAVAAYGVRPTEIQAIGCRSRGQANRYARWLIDTEINETEIVTYRAGLDHADVLPGEVVDIADPSYAGVRYGGRLAGLIDSGGDKVGVIIDAPVVLSPTETYTITIALSDGSLADRVVTSPAGETTELTFDTPLDPAKLPVDSAMWMLTGSDAAPRPFRILSVLENENHQFDITGMFYDETKYLRVEQNIVLDPPAFSAYPTGAIRPPTNITLSEYIYLAGGTTVRTAVSVGITASTDPRVNRYEYEILRPGLDWEEVAATSSILLDIEDLDPGVYRFRVRGVFDLSQARSPWLESGDIVLNAINQPPGNVEGLRISVMGDQSTLYWRPVQSLLLSHYVVKFTPDTASYSWGSAAVQLAYVDTTSVQVPTRAGVYLVKAVSIKGVESNLASFVISLEEGNLLNAVETFVEQPGWTGIRSSVFVDPLDRLRLASIDNLDDWTSLSAVPSLDYGENGLVSQGTYTSAQTVDLGEVYTSRITPLLSVFGADLRNVMLSWTSLSSVASISGTDPTVWDCELQERHTNDDPTSPGAVWSDWTESITGDITARAFQMRLVLSTNAPNVTPIVRRAELTVDMPDRLIDGNDIVVPAGGIRIDFEPPYKALKGMGIVPQELQTGDYFEVTAKDRTGFNIIFKNSSGVSVERSLDFVANGYGRIQ